MAIGDVTGTRSSNTSNTTNKSQPSNTTPTSSSSQESATALPTPTADNASVDRKAAQEVGNTDRVGDVVAGLSETPAATPADPNAGALGRIADITSADHKKYGEQTTTPNGRVIDPGVKEGQSPLKQDIKRMWENVGVKGRDGSSKEPWSAAYISDVMNRAGVDNFQKSIRHSEYISGAIDARKNGDTEASHWGYRTSERAPQAGDLVCFERDNSGATFDDQRGGKYASHCDIVTGVRDGAIDTIGGNVGNSVSTRSFTTDENGMINDKAQKWIAILAPQQLGTQQ